MSDLFEHAVKHEPNDTFLITDKSRRYYKVESNIDTIVESIKNLQSLGRYLDEDSYAEDVARDASSHANDIDSALDNVIRFINDMKDAYDTLEEQVEYWKDRAKDYSDTLSTCLIDDLEYTVIEFEGWKTEWVVWARDNIKGKWTLTAETDRTWFYFEDPKEATYFKMSMG